MAIGQSKITLAQYFRIKVQTQLQVHNCKSLVMFSSSLMCPMQPSLGCATRCKCKYCHL